MLQSADFFLFLSDIRPRELDIMMKTHPKICKSRKKGVEKKCPISPGISLHQKRAHYS